MTTLSSRVLLSIAVLHFAVLAVSSTVPPASSLSPGWLEEMPLRQMPMVQNFFGSAYLRRDVVPGFGLVGLGPITLAPFDINFQNSSLRLNGETVLLNKTEGWGGAEAHRFGENGWIRVSNSVTMLFESYVTAQRWKFGPSSSQETAARIIDGLKVELVMDGPFGRSCEAMPPCGWGFNVPVDRLNFLTSLVETSDIGPGGNVSVMLTSDSLTHAVTASAVWSDDSAAAVVVERIVANSTFAVTVTNVSAKSTLYHAFAVAANAEAAINSLLSVVRANKFDAVWNSSNDQWEARWKSAFASASSTSPIADGAPLAPHFSGSLPVLSAPDFPDVERLYYWASLALVSLERTNLLSAERNYVISEGPSNAYDGSSGMGGSGQFVWDLSFAAVSYTLLDPVATEQILTFVIHYSDFTVEPFAIPQCWDAFPSGVFNGGLGTYVFDYVATFLFIHQFVSLTNATLFMNTPIVLAKTPHGNRTASITPLKYIQELAWAWTKFPRWNASSSPFITDYGDNKRLFLEAVPTYMGAVAALQFANAGMLLAYARAVEAYGSGGEDEKRDVLYARGNATGIVTDTMRLLLVEGKGFFRCLYRNGSSQPVRSIADYNYVGLSLGVLGRDVAGFLPRQFRSLAVDFFTSELLVDAGWVRALSLSDPVMKNVNSMNPSVEDLVAMRSDWTGTGGYGGLAGLAIDSTADLGHDSFDNAVHALVSIARVTFRSNPAQGIATMTPLFMLETDIMNRNDGKLPPEVPYGPAWPEFFDEPQFPPSWPQTSRAVQNSVAAVVDAIIRSIFGWRPDWLSSSSTNLTTLLHRPRERRSNFSGTLSFLRTPFGCVNITAADDGLSWAFC